MYVFPLALACLVSAGHESQLSSSALSGRDEEDPMIRSLANLFLTSSPAIFTGRHLPVSRRSSAQRSTVMEDGVKVKVKVKVRKPSVDAAAEDLTKVKVQIPADSEDAKPVTHDSAAESTAVKVTVKAPVKQKAPGDSWYGLSELEQKLVDGSRGNNKLLLEALIEGVNPNLVDDQGRTVLHYVAASGFAPTLTLLIHYGAQVDVQDKAGLTPMHMAAGYAKARCLTVLIAAGADTEIESPQGTPLNVLRNLGNAQLNTFLSRTGAEKLTKRKDDRLEALRSCLEVFDNIDRIKADSDWDELVKEVLKVIVGIPKKDKN